MSVKRIIDAKEKNKLKDSKKYKTKKVSNLSQSEKDDLLEIIANKLNLL